MHQLVRDRWRSEIFVAEKPENRFFFSPQSERGKNEEN
jgi:hypothetical protein